VQASGVLSRSNASKYTRQLLAKNSFDGEHFTKKSLKVGRVTNLLNAGEPLENVQLLGGLTVIADDPFTTGPRPRSSNRQKLHIYRLAVQQTRRVQLLRSQQLQPGLPVTDSPAGSRGQAGEVIGLSAVLVHSIFRHKICPSAIIHR
jgi:hypothetical protein